MAKKELHFHVSSNEFKSTIGNMTNEIDDYIDRQYRERLKKLLQDVFSELISATEEGLSGKELEKVIENALLSLSDMIVEGASDIIVAVTALTQAFLKGLTKGDFYSNLKEQRHLIEQMNSQLEYRNSLLEIAITLNNAMVDTTEELIEYQIMSAELLTENLGLGSDFSNINLQNLLSDYETINQQILEIENQISELENDTSGNIITGIWNWVSKLWGGSKEDRLNDLEKQLAILKEQAKQYEELAGLIKQINNLKRKEIEETYKIQEYQSKLSGDNIGLYKVRIDYYIEMLKRSKELGLSELEILEIEYKLNEVIKERLDYMISQYDKEQDLIIKKAKLNGATEKQLNKLRLEALENMIQAKRYEIDTLGSTIDREHELIDLELERLSLQKEINGELEQQGLLYDKNFRSILRSVIEARKLGNNIEENDYLINALRILINKGYSVNEINRLLGTNFSMEDFPGIINNDYELPDVNDLINKMEIDIKSDTRLANDLSLNSNRLHLQELTELREHKKLLLIQNFLLENIEQGITGIGFSNRFIGGTFNRNTNSASNVHRYLGEINRVNRQ